MGLQVRASQTQESMGRKKTTTKNQRYEETTENGNSYLYNPLWCLLDGIKFVPGGMEVTHCRRVKEELITLTSKVGLFH